MNPGDRVRLQIKKPDKEETLEGLYLPRPELLNQDIIVIKLDSGYNIGIDKKHIVFNML